MSNSLQTQKCPICHGTAKFYCLKCPAEYFRCPNCGTILQYPLPSVQEMAAYANQEYSDGGLYREYVQARDLKYATFRKRIHKIREYTEGNRLFDVGCSCGYLIDVALEEDFDAYGAEFSTVAIAAASEKARARIFHADVNQIAMIRQAPYDVVTAFDIIEHTLDPIQFLVNLKSILRKRGLLVITTPDTNHLLRFLMRQGWPMLQPFQHTILLSRHSLRQALQVAGYGDIELMPAYKVLTSDYLTQQIRLFNPLATRLYDLVSRAVPKQLRNKPISVNIGEIMALARLND